MKTYKYTDTTNQVVHIIDEDGISRGSCLASILEHDAVIEPNDPPDHNTAINEQIIALESTITGRRIREAALGIGTEWLANVDMQISALRAQRV